MGNGKKFPLFIQTFIINSLVNRKVNMWEGTFRVKTIFILGDTCFKIPDLPFNIGLSVNTVEFKKNKCLNLISCEMLKPNYNG